MSVDGVAKPPSPDTYAHLVPTAADALPPGEWVTGPGGVKCYRESRFPEPADLLEAVYENGRDE